MSYESMRARVSLECHSSAVSAGRQSDVMGPNILVIWVERTPFQYPYNGTGSDT